MRKKKLSKKKPARHSTGLTERVRLLELDMRKVKSEMGEVVTEVAALKKTVTQVDARTMRGEKMLMEMQGEARRTSKMVDRIAQHFALTVEPPTPHAADPGDSNPPDADEPE